MVLNDEELQTYYDLHFSILLFANTKLKLFPEVNLHDTFLRLSLEQKFEIRNALYENKHLFKEFVDTNPYKFEDEQLSIIERWKHLVDGKFIIFKQYQKYAVFLSLEAETKAYGVHALADRFEDLLPQLPAYVDAVLLPFGDKIVYDGIFTSQSIGFGASVRREFNIGFQKAKARYGIITSLPAPTVDPLESQKDLLRTCIKKSAQDWSYEEEITQILDEYPELEEFYDQIISELTAKGYKKQLREYVNTTSWFALCDDLIVASGASKQEVIENAGRILKNKYVDDLYVFSVKKRGGK